MANQNISRLKGRHKKRDICVFYTTLNYDEIAISADVYQLAEIPPESIVLSATALPIVQNDAGTSATFDLGWDGGAELIDDGDLKTAAGTAIVSSTVPLHLPTGATLTFVPTYGGTAATAGQLALYIEYLEYEQCTGELTNFVS
jgi:hypothetical protein